MLSCIPSHLNLSPQLWHSLVTTACPACVPVLGVCNDDAQPPWAQSLRLIGSGITNTDCTHSCPAVHQHTCTFHPSSGTVLSQQHALHVCQFWGSAMMMPSPLGLRVSGLSGRGLLTQTAHTHALLYTSTPAPFTPALAQSCHNSMPCMCASSGGLQ